MDHSSSLAVYTTIYPDVRSYLLDWYGSLCRQTDQNYQLWIGLDELDRDDVESFLGCEVDAQWLAAPRGSSPAEIRQRALSEIVDACTGVVLVDSDDVLDSSRVEAARSLLDACDLGGCALQLVDEQGKELNLTFNLPYPDKPEDVFPRCNLFGFSNSVFRTDLLRRCLPIAGEAVLVDWFLATRAWLLGGKMGFDRVPRMKYRQHPGNMAHVRLPFCDDQVVSHTELVRRHFKLVLAVPLQGFVEARYEALVRVQAEVEEFWRRIVLEPMKLGSYVNALNELAPVPIWWTSVAHPSLEYMWR